MSPHPPTVASRQHASLRYLHIAPRKVRSVADTLRGLPLSEAEAQLLMRPERAARPLLKLLRSAAAGAKMKRLNPDELVIATLRVDQGTMIKRFLPRAQGRATPIQKKMSHVTVVLETRPGVGKPRFAILPPPKKEKTKKEREVKPKAAEPKKEGVVDARAKKPGFFRRIFRRKSV